MLSQPHNQHHLWLSKQRDTLYIHEWAWTATSWSRLMATSEPPASRSRMRGSLVAAWRFMLAATGRSPGHSDVIDFFASAHHSFWLRHLNLKSSVGWYWGPLKVMYSEFLDYIFRIPNQAQYILFHLIFVWWLCFHYILILKNEFYQDALKAMCLRSSVT